MARIGVVLSGCGVYDGSEIHESVLTLYFLDKLGTTPVIMAPDIDALIFPGGYGAAKNLCTFAFDGTNCKVNDDVARLAKDVYSLGKPIGAICITPVMIAKIFGDITPVELTIGTDKETASAINTMGGRHISCQATNIIIDSKNRIVSTPAYMIQGSIKEIGEGIEKLVNTVLEMVKK